MKVTVNGSKLQIISKMHSKAIKVKEHQPEESKISEESRKGGI